MAWTTPQTGVVMVIDGRLCIVTAEEAARREDALTPEQKAVRARIAKQFRQEADMLGWAFEMLKP